jgi:menaquinone-dependent protoporphyrinogen oxidase
VIAMQILVVYGTKHGSTGEVAEAIADRLRTHGIDVDCGPAANVEELEGYDAVVVGGALYMGRWHADAQAFLKRHSTSLSGKPVAVFAMGPQTTGTADIEGSRRQLARALQRIRTVEPVTTAIFGGVVDPDTLRFPFNRMAAADARDWGAIELWADALPALLSVSRAGVTSSA